MSNNGLVTYSYLGSHSALTEWEKETECTHRKAEDWWDGASTKQRGGMENRSIPSQCYDKINLLGIWAYNGNVGLDSAWVAYVSPTWFPDLCTMRNVWSVFMKHTHAWICSMDISEGDT